MKPDLSLLTKRSYENTILKYSLYTGITGAMMLIQGMIYF